MKRNTYIRTLDDPKMGFVTLFFLTQPESTWEHQKKMDETVVLLLKISVLLASI